LQLIYSVLIYSFILGSFMFTAIEGDYVEERSAILNKTQLATRLWEIACCKTNVFNKTLFDELWVSFLRFKAHIIPIYLILISFNKTLFCHKISLNRVGAEIKIHQDNLVHTARKGFQGDIDSESPWTFAGSFLYSLTVITTIGRWINLRT
jgi:hypothetical protein